MSAVNQVHEAGNATNPTQSDIQTPTLAIQCTWLNHTTVSESISEHQHDWVYLLVILPTINSVQWIANIPTLRGA